MSGTPGVGRYAVRALTPELQRAFDRLAESSSTRAAKLLGLTTHQVDALMYGGRASVAVVERVEAQLRKGVVPCR